MRRLLALLLILILNAEWIGSAAASIPHFRFPGSAAHQGGGTLAAPQDLALTTTGGLTNTGQLLDGRDAAFTVGCTRPRPARDGSDRISGNSAQTDCRPGA